MLQLSQKTKKTQFPRSLGSPGVSETGPQDLWGIGFFEFFETVSAFRTSWIGFIGFL